MQSLVSNSTGERSAVFTGQPSRRDLMKAAAGLGLSFLLPGLSARSAEQRGSQRPKSMITLWLAGGPSQLETWDPHPGTAIGGPTGSIATSIPGLEIADLYPHVAEQIDAMSVVRSLVSKEGDHERGTYYLKTGYRPDPTLKHPSVGAILTHELPDPAVEIPMHFSLCGSQWPSRGGFLGGEFDAFKIFDPGRNPRNMRSRVGQKRQDRRLENLQIVTGAFRARGRRQVDDTLHRQTIDRALNMMSSEQLAALTIDDEPTGVVDSYGDTQFGRGCLVARRLVETGVRAIEVTLRGFDSHAGNFDAHSNNAATLDPAFAALIKDLKDRDLLDSTVVLCIGEFGRTPKINPLDGRDHWPSGFSCVVGGGGLHSGLVIGETDPQGEKKDPSDPIEVQDLFATIYRAIGVDYEQEVLTPIGRPMALGDGAPIERLLPS